jgi:hypothetical protein
MAEIKEFVINDRRKFTAEGDPRPDAPPSEPRPPRPETQSQPAPESSARLVDTPARSSAPGPLGVPASAHAAQPEAGPNRADSAPGDSGETTGDLHDDSHDDSQDENLPPPPTAEQTSQATTAYDATVARLDTAIRATNPGMEPIPQMTFERVIQSLYMQALMQLGAAAEPGQKPQVDILGARQTIDMLAIVAGKTKGNLTPDEATLVDNALFELRMGFLEMTQALARQAQSKAPQSGPAGFGGSGAPAGPSIVR